MTFSNICPVCGGSKFTHNEVLWPELISEWELLPHEVDYINRQQGFICVECGNNLRSMALADSILKKFNFNGILKDFVYSDAASSLKVLEINDAGGLNSTLSNMPNHLLIKYPEYDMEALSLDSESFDLVVHSDTLEHVNNPVKGLSECKRVLKKTGACIFTVPIVVERLSRTRQGLASSFHGNNTTSDLDLIVHTEFGADFWHIPILAGFDTVTLDSFEFPAALSIKAE